MLKVTFSSSGGAVLENVHNLVGFSFGSTITNFYEKIILSDQCPTAAVEMTMPS